MVLENKSLIEVPTAVTCLQLALAFTRGLERTASLEVDQFDGKSLSGIGTFPAVMLRETTLQVIGRPNVPIPVRAEENIRVCKAHLDILARGPMARHPKCERSELLDGGRYRT